MLTYYHGTTRPAAEAIIKNIDVSKGCGELGQGFYIGSSLWRAFSWAWNKAQKEGAEYRVIAFQIDEKQFGQLDILCQNTQSTRETYKRLKQSDLTTHWTSHHDAIWAPIVGQNIKNVYQIKFESVHGEYFINKQKKYMLCN